MRSGTYLADKATNWCFAVTGMLISSIFIPQWISYHVSTPKGGDIQIHVGLHERCFSNQDPQCREYPPAELCTGREGETFCSLWRTIGFAASFSAILCLASLVCLVVVIKGGRYRRETGWPLVSGMLSLVSVIEFFIIAAVVCCALYLFPQNSLTSTIGPCFGSLLTFFCVRGTGISV